eukprot:c45494_g1_i1.p1 GENE.c45494_g1_i1~~c45494_g1_i1.p1  ORF type:complete len:443 (-),score=93.86 c45494_g1_i1:41-1369(-)
MSTIFKIRKTSVLGNDEVRRMTFPNGEITLDKIRERVKRLFNLPDNQVWFFKYQDEEGDHISLSEEYEMNDLLDWSWSRGEGQTRIVRLEVYVEPAVRVSVQPEHPPFCPPFCRQFFGQPSPTQPSGEAQANGAEEVGGRCDKSNVRLVPGQGWWHLPGTTYDLSHAEWEKLDDAERGRFVLVNSSKDLGDDAQPYRIKRCGFGGPRRGCWARRWCGTASDCGKSQSCDAKPTEPQSSTDDKTAIAKMHEFFEKASTQLAQQVELQVPPQPTRPALSVEVVAGPSVMAGSIVAPGARIVALWEIRNSAADGLLTDVRIKPVSPNPLQAREEGFEVPLVQAGDSGLVMVEVTIPHELAGQGVVAEFEFVDSSGTVFGDRLILDVRVEAPQPVPNVLENEDELVSMLQDMGFMDDDQSRIAVRETKGDVNAAALRLLRQHAARK